MVCVNCFIRYGSEEPARRMVECLSKLPLVKDIYLLTTDPEAKPLPACSLIHTDHLWSSDAIRQIIERSGDAYSMIYTGHGVLQPGMRALERLVNIACDVQAGMVYADYYEKRDGVRTAHPLAEYQAGSLRDDFDFGPVLLYAPWALKAVAETIDGEYNYAGLYDLRLQVSAIAAPVHVNEYLFTDEAESIRLSGEKMFDYVDPKNRHVQLEMERACSDSLKKSGALLPPSLQKIDFGKEPFDVEASVIIPVRNRVRTIEDAIRSALQQQPSFRFNVIVIDNYSTDGTTEKIQSFMHDPRVVYIRPEADDLGIGGCWNMGVHHPACGRFAVQLDSDDVYSNPLVLQQIVDAFYEQGCAMVVGTYMMTDFHLSMIAPGIIDHKEWTPENGHNNALRVNGLGAPRAFFTPILREINLPNTSYGEDYAIGLRISREYRIGRIYEVLYCCRRWEGNSDAALSVQKLNEYNTYKDKIRTWELEARKAIVKARGM